MNINRNTISRNLLLFSPLILFLLLMLPRLVSAQFGFLDDAQVFHISESILDGSWTPSEDFTVGRFRPVFWIFYALITLLKGWDPFWFYVGNVLLFASITIGLMTIVNKLSRNRYQGIIAGFLFVLAGPTVETVYTLSKAELLQGFFLVSFLFVYRIYSNAESQRYRAISIFVIALTVWLAASVKETAVILLPISFFWVIIEWKPGSSSLMETLNARRGLLIGTSMGVAAYIVFRGIVSTLVIPDGSYASNFNFQGEHMLSQLKVWSDLINHNFLYLLPLAVVPIIRMIKDRTLPQLHLIMKSILWMVVWIGIYIPWNFSPEYYLFPFAGGVAVLGSSLVAINLQSMRQQYANLARAFIAIAILLFLLTLPNLFSNARLQLAVDASNQEMLDYVLENVPVDGVVLINMQVANEYSGNFNTLVNAIHGRPDLQIDLFDPLVLNELMKESGELYIVSPIIENHFYPSVRMGVYENQAREWNATLQSSLRGEGNLIYQGRSSFRLLNIDSLRILCPALKFLEYCQVPNSPIDRRVFSYGWDIYRVSNANDSG